MAVYAGGATDIGPQRAQNEDGFVLLHSHRAFAVADGSGGTADLLARAALDAFASLYKSTPPVVAHPTNDDGLFASTPALSVQQRNRVVAAVRLANAAAHKLVQSAPAFKGCGTTFLALEIDEESATFAWVGEPRAYRFDVATSKVTALTRPHTLVNEQLAAGLISESDARTSNFKNIVTRVLGFQPHVEVDSLTVAVKKQDVFVLCTDGVWQALEEDGIARVLAGFFLRRGFTSGLTDAAQALITAANAKTVGDNVAAVVVERL